MARSTNKISRNKAYGSNSGVENTGSRPHGKNIILLSDGTGNSRAKVWKSNIWRLYKALDLTDNTKQVAYYDDGVGTSSFKLFSVLGGIFGFGLARNVREIYAFLCRNYEPGDRIYLLGFSRGAFTTRMLAGLICHQGIVPYNNEKDLQKQVYSAYRAFRQAAFGTSAFHWLFITLAAALELVPFTRRGVRGYQRSENSAAPASDKDVSPIVHFMGLFDTVDAYGGPIDELTVAFDKVVYPLTAKDRTISDRIVRVCHALALDEQRQSFEPMLVNEADDHGRLVCKEEADHVDKERISQVWFNGVHSDIGGGYPDDGQAHVALRWMIERCEGLPVPVKFLPAERDSLFDTANFTARLNDSRNGIGTFYRYEPRHLERLSDDTKYSWLERIKRVVGADASANQVRVGTAKIHHSVLDRIRHSADAHTPINLPGDYQVVDSCGSIRKLPTSASGNWRWEVAAQAETRREQQNVVWNRVWWGRILYFVTLFTIAAFLLIPFIGESILALPWIGELIERFLQWLGVLSGHAGTLSDQIGGVPKALKYFTSSLPGADFTSSVLDYYGSSPKTGLIFIFFAVAIFTLIMASARNKSKLRENMGELFYHMSRAKSSGAPSQTAGWRQKLADLLNSGGYQNFKWLIKASLRVLAAIGVLILAVAIISRIIFLLFDGIGLVCANSEKLVELNAVHSQSVFRFHGDYPCQQSGIRMTSGNYRIEVAALVPTPAGFAKLHFGGAAKGAAGGIDAGIGNADTTATNTHQADAASDVLAKIRKWQVWSDWTLKTDLAGWRENGLLAGLSLPFRRHLFVDWYEPIISIGDKGYHRLSLINNLTRFTEQSTPALNAGSDLHQDEADEVNSAISQQECHKPSLQVWSERDALGSMVISGVTHVQQLTTCFNYDGGAHELYLHVNDAIGPLFPIIPWLFYCNNEGFAEVRVTRLAGRV